jgi:hypothetical protein
MNRPSSLWTFVLYPLTLAGAVTFAIVLAERAWLAAAMLGAALAFTLWRLVAALEMRLARRAHVSAQAALWKGEQPSVGLGVRRLARGLVSVLAGVPVALVIAVGFRWHWLSLLLLLLAVVNVLRFLVLVFESTGPLLQITRQGVWDRHFGWIRWEHVAAVEFSDLWYRYDARPRQSALVMRLRGPALDLMQQRPVGGGSGLPVAFLGHSRETISYTLDWLDLPPEHAFAAARGWLKVSRDGTPPPVHFEEATARVHEQRYVHVLQRMRSSTQLLLLSYGLAPLALVVDKMVGWPR